MALKLWNGHISAYPSGHAFVCGESQADAVDMINYALGQRTTVHDLRTYWHSGTWGNQMDGVVPERGLWLMPTRNVKPLRLWVPERRA